MAPQLEDTFLEQDDDMELGLIQLEESDVAEYLRQNPNFFKKHADIMSDVVAPERRTGDGVVDLQRVMLDRNSSELDELRNCAQEVCRHRPARMPLFWLPPLQKISHIWFKLLIRTGLFYWMWT